MPSLLGCAAVHHHLIRQGLRTSVGLVVESAEPREVHHFGCLAGYGAEAINPYLAFETLIAMHADLPGKLDKKEIVKRYIKAIDKGLLKVMSKMGISTYQSYCGAQIFDAVGLKAEFVNKYFTGTATRIEGVGLERDRRGGGAPPPRCVRRLAGVPRHARRRRRIRGAGARRGPCLERHHGLDLAARGARQFAGQVPRVREDPQRAGHAGHHPRPVPRQDRGGGRAQARAARRGRAGQEHRQALRHRRDVVRLDLARGAHHARHRHEPDRRQVEHRRRRRGGRPLQAAAERRLDALGDQAGRLGPLRRHRRVSRQLGHDADQDGAGRQARRRRPIAGPQGRQDHRQGAPFDAGRRAHFAAAAPRHLFDRGPGAAHLRSEERQSGRRRVGEARLRGRRRHRRRRRVEGALRPCDDLGLRGRHRREPPHLAQACRLAVGDRPRRNPPDAGGQPAAQPHRRAGRRRHPHRPRRGDRRAAWAPTSSASRPRR